MSQFIITFIIFFIIIITSPIWGFALDELLIKLIKWIKK